MPDPKLIITNQFGEKSINTVDETNSTFPATAEIMATPLTGLAAGTNTTILAADTLIVALAKLQAQIDAL